MVLSGNERRAEEAHASAEAMLEGVTDKEILQPGFRDGFFPYDGAQIKEFFESLKPFEPDLILTHQRNDLHQDHRMAHQLALNTFRNHLILEYEIPKYDGDMGAPNFSSRSTRSTRTARSRSCSPTSSPSSPSAGSRRTCSPA